ncbi:MAG: DUF3786 domain-containing protein [Desulfobacterales bacterium]
MPAPKNAMEIFRLLNQSNCRECGEKTCLAFAGAVYQNRRQLADCPHLEPAVIERYRDAADAPSPLEAEGEAYLQALLAQVQDLDFVEAARRTGGELRNGKLTLKVLGKDLSVDRQGRLSADIHVNPWVATPYLNYLLHSQGRLPSGNWVPFRELEGGRERAALFQKRCELELKKLADRSTDFFDDIIHMFSGKQVARQFAADISVVLHPLPRVPLMICYWKPEDGLGSSLNLFFDQTADANLDIGSLFSIGAGIALMFHKLSLRHGFSSAQS